MVKDKITLLLILLIIGNGLSASEKPFKFKGSYEFSVNEDNLLRNEYVETEVGPTFDSELNLETIFSQPLKNETIELGMSLDINNALKFIEGEDSDSKYTTSDKNLYSKIQKMIDWYVNNRSKYGMPKYPGKFSTQGSWPTTSYNGESGKNYQFIVGHTVQDINSVAWTSDKWTSALHLYNVIELEIRNEINKIDEITDDVDQFEIDALTSEKKKLVLKERDALESFENHCLGKDSSSKMGDLFTSGYIRFNNLFNLFDLGLEYKGSNVAIGRSLSSQRATLDDSLLGMKLSLAQKEDEMQNLSAGLLVVLAEGEESTVEDWETKTHDQDDGEVGDLGVLLNCKYTQKGLGSLEVDFGFTDVSNPENFILGLYPTVDIWHKYKLKAAGEFDLFGYKDKDNENESQKIGMGAALDVQATYKGLTPRTKVLWKNDQFFGNNVANIEEDRLPGTSYLDDFNSSNVKMAAALDAGLTFDTSKLIGREIFSVGGGYNLLLYNPTSDSDIIRGGWYSNVNVSLKDTTEIPMNINLNISKYDHPDLIKFDDYNGTGAESSLFDGLSWNLSMDYIYSEYLSFSGFFTGKDSGNRFSNDPIVTWGLSVLSRF